MYIFKAGCCLLILFDGFQIVLGESAVLDIHAVCACICVRSNLCTRGSYELQTCNEYLIKAFFLNEYQCHCDLFIGLYTSGDSHAAHVVLFFCMVV